MTPRFHLRAATAADYEFMRSVGHEGLRPHLEPLSGWDQDEHDRAFRAAFDPATQQVVETDGGPAGYLHVVLQPGHTLLAGLYLGAAWRGRGLGGAVLAEVCRRADAGGRELRLRVHRGNPAERLYARHGFVVVGETPTQRHMLRRPRRGEQQP